MKITKKLTVALEPEIHKQLKQIVFEKEMKQQEVIAKAISAYFNLTVGKEKK